MMRICPLVSDLDEPLFDDMARLAHFLKGFISDLRS